MNEALIAAVEQLITTETGQPARIATVKASGGGCINDARVIALEDGRPFFVKANSAPLDGMFDREAEGLRALAAVGAIRVPRPIGTGGQAGSAVAPFLVMEAIEPGGQRNDFFTVFGQQFAELHRQSRTERFGFESANWIGSTPQPNDWCGDWCEFWREHRLGFQLRLARERGLTDATFDRLGEALLDRLDELISEPDEPACLLHGDLWGGNYLADDAGQPVLIDPATYHGRREADLAMTMLFGGFSGAFYAAYEEVWPLAPGADERLEIYKLYHVLNHLNLFGGSYRGQCLSILRRFA